MSGTGKSTLVHQLRAQGYTAIDMDEPGWSEYGEGGDWVWQEERVAALLAEDESEFLFISGCAENQVKFYPQFDEIILLSAPADVLVERLRMRTNNPYGKWPEEVAEVLYYLETVEPMLRRGATQEIRTNIPLEQVVETVLSTIIIRD
jgi:dephospho-CoA kinase